MLSAGFGAVLEDQRYHVDLAGGGGEGIALFTGGHFDLAILDRGLPDMDGCELCRRIRRMNEHIPLLMLAPAGGETMIQGFAAGADDCLSLPADAREFLARIRALIRRTLPMAAGPNKLKTGDIELDNDAKLVSKGGRVVAVTTSEFLLLEYMLKNKNRVVTREELAAGAWGGRRQYRPGSLPVHMNGLRKKLKGQRGPQPIYTVTGKGYLLLEKETG